MRCLLKVLAILVAASAPAHAQESKYYELPKGDYPHDVAVGPSGEVWYAGQNLGIAGRLNPATGEIERIALGKKSAPHGVIVGPDGAPWFTDGGQNAIVRVDPTTSGQQMAGAGRQSCGPGDCRSRTGPSPRAARPEQGPRPARTTGDQEPLADCERDRRQPDRHDPAE